VDKHIIKPKHF